MGHTWVPASIDAPKTCSVCGETEGDRLPSDSSSTDDDSSDPDSSVGGEKEAPGEENGTDDGNGLSGGAIAAIVSGSTVTAGAGGFSLFWFVIKKKSWADLLGVFKKK